MATQHVCYGQSHPKVDSLFNYLKEIGVVNACEYNNIRQFGLMKSFGISCDVVPGIDKVSSYELPDGTKMPDDELQKEKNKMQAVKRIRHIFAELNADAIESHNYEFHEPCKDSIVAGLTLKMMSENGIPIEMPGGADFRRSNQFGKLYFKYDMKPCKDGIYAAQWALSYRVLVDKNANATKSLDVDSLMRRLEPVFKDKIFKNKKVQKRTILVRYDEDFKGYDDKLARKKGFEFFHMPKPNYDGESNTLVCKFTDEETAKSVLTHLMDSVRNYVAHNPHEAYSILSDDYFALGYLANLFSGGGMMGRKGANKLDVYASKDPDGGYYILLNFSKNCWNVPKDWRTLKKRVSAKSEFYKESF
jgi:hypothetical protein